MCSNANNDSDVSGRKYSIFSFSWQHISYRRWEENKRIANITRHKFDQMHIRYSAYSLDVVEVMINPDNLSATFRTNTKKFNR